MPKSGKEKKDATDGPATPRTMSRLASFVTTPPKSDKLERPPMRLRGGSSAPPLPPPPLTSRNIVDNMPPISSEPVSRRDSFSGPHHYGAVTSSGMGTPSSTHNSYAGQAAADRPISTLSPASQEAYLRVSCAKVYFPNVQTTVEFPAGAVAAFNNTTRSATTLNSPSILSPTSGAAGAFSVAHSQQELPLSFMAADIENIIQLRSSLGTSAGLLSSTITGGKDHPLSPASHASVGVLPRNAPNSLLCGHPLVLFKVRSSAASAFNCFPRFGMLQRHPGDTINFFSASELMAGGVGDSLTAIERASERLSVTIRRREEEEAPAAGSGSGVRTRSPSRHPIATRDVEFLRIEYIVILDTPTQVAVKNALRDKLEAIPITKQESGSKAAASNLKALQPTISMLYDELKVRVPIVTSLNGSAVHTHEAPEIIQKSDTIAPQPPATTGCISTDSATHVRAGHVDITCYMDCGSELAEYIPKHQGERFVQWSGIADEDGAKDFTERTSADGKPSQAKVQHPLPIHQNAFVRLRIRQSREGSIASGQTGSTPRLTGGKNSPPIWQGSSPKTPQHGVAKSFVATVEPSTVPVAPTKIAKASLLGGGCPVGVVVLLVVLLYSFVYAWRHCKEI